MAAINGDETEEGSGGEGRDEIRFDAIGIGFVQSRRMKKRDERERERKTIGIGIEDAESRKIIRFLETIEFRSQERQRSPVIDDPYNSRLVELGKNRG